MLLRTILANQGVTVEQDPDEYSTDLGKNVARLTAIETGSIPPPHNPKSPTQTKRPTGQQFQIVLIGGLSGRLDQTIHTLHAMTLLAEKEKRDRVWAIGTVGNAPTIIGVRVRSNNLENVPETMPFSTPAQTPGHGRPTQWFFKNV